MATDNASKGKKKADPEIPLALQSLGREDLEKCTFVPFTVTDDSLDTPKMVILRAKPTIAWSL